MNSKCDKDKEELRLIENNSHIVHGKCDKPLNTEYVQNTKIAQFGDGSLTKEKTTVDIKPSKSHSRQSSDSCYTSSSAFSDISENKNRSSNMVVGELGNCTQGNVVGLHRKMVK